MQRTMDERIRNRLLETECLIKKLYPAKDEYELYTALGNAGKKEKLMLESLLRKRRDLLDGMLLLTPAETARMEAVNGRLYDLTQRLYAKTYSIYNSLLEAGRDTDFDDDVTIEGRLRFVVDDWEEGSSVLGMEEDTLYGSDFVRMMDILSILAGDGPWHPAGTFISYSPKHIPGMDPAELGLINSLDDGASWDHAGLFPGICVCHAVYALRNDNLFSYPDPS